jgi:hypothetical protein
LVSWCGLGVIGGGEREVSGKRGERTEPSAAHLAELGGGGVRGEGLEQHVALLLADEQFAGLHLKVQFYELVVELRFGSSLFFVFFVFFVLLI